MFGFRRYVGLLINLVPGICCALLLAFSTSLQAQDKVRLQLRFDHQFQFAGYYAAQWQGYYEEAGLDVEIISGINADGRMIVAPDSVANGNAEFGIGAGDVLLAIDRGNPLVIVASIFQQSPIELFAQRSAQLTSPADLINLKVLQDASPVVQAEIFAMLHAEGIRPGAVKFIEPIDHLNVMGRINALLTGKVDVMSGFALSIPWYAKEQGVQLTSLRPAAYGVDFYGDSIFTTAALANKNPELVQRFRDASIRGWRYAMENQDVVADRIAREYPHQLPVTNLQVYNRFLAAKIRTLMNYPYMEIGHVNPNRWRRMHEQLRLAGAVTNALSDDELVFNPVKIAYEKQQKTLKRALQVSILLVFAISVLSIIYLARAKRHAEHSAQRYRSLFDDSPVSIWEEDFSDVKIYLEQQMFSHACTARVLFDIRPEVLDECVKRVRVLDVNRASLKMYGADSREALMRGMAETFTAESLIVFREELIALVEGNLSFLTETRVQSLAGAALEIELSLLILPAARANWNHVVVLMADITARKRAEQMRNRYETMVSTTADLMAYVSTDYRYLAVNDSYSRAFMKNKEVIVGMQVNELIGTELFDQSVKRHIDRCLAGNKVSYEISMQFPGAGLRHLGVNHYPITDASGKIDGLMMHLHDMTEIKNLENELLQHRENLEQLVQYRTEKLTYALQENEAFSYSVSHDLRAPLRSISGFSMALMEDCGDSLDARGHEHLQRIIKNVKKMDEQINGLLSLSRINQSDLNYSRFEINQIVTELVDRYKPQYPGRQIDLVMEQGLEIYGDRHLIEIALDNLISNAIKFSSKKSQSHIEFGKVVGSDMYTIFIRDNGIGFDMRYADKLFVVFQRLQNEFEGIGIGLATVQRVVLRHGGKIWVDSVPGESATFYMSFPGASKVAVIEAMQKN